MSELEYDLGLLFDHRMARTNEHPFRVSRLRVSSAAREVRFSIIATGLHGALYHVRRRLQPGWALDTSLRNVSSAVDEHNRSVYEREEIVEEFGRRAEIMAPEEYLFDSFVPDGASILDLGVGAGRTIPRLSRGAAKYIGVDYSAPMVDQCRAAHPDTDIRLLDASDLDSFDRDTFDVVVFSFNGLDYMHPAAKRAACIAEMARVIRPGGVVILSSHNARALIRPRTGASRGLRALAIQAYASLRQVGRALPSRAFWQGRGYVRDSASDHVNYAVTPASARQEFADHGFALEAQVSSRYPAHLGPLVEPWYYYAFRRKS